MSVRTASSSKHAAQVWWTMLGQAVARDLQFRSQTWLNLLAGLAEMAIGIVPVLVLDGYASNSAGLSAGTGLLIVAIYGISAGVIDAFAAPGLRRLDQTIRRGELDIALLRPTSTYLCGVLRWMQPAETGKAVAGVALLVDAVVRGQVSVSPLGAVVAAVWVVAGVVAYTCLWSNLVFLAFWTRSIEPVNEPASGVRTAGQYPLGYFPSWARAALVTTLPAGLLAAYPAQQLSAPSWTVLLALPGAAAGVGLTSAHWRAGLRRYDSASS